MRDKGAEVLMIYRKRVQKGAEKKGVLVTEFSESSENFLIINIWADHVVLTFGDKF